MRILIVTLGTRGDVQPMIALARGLEAAGHSARIASHIDFGPLARAHGIAYTPICGSFRELLESDRGRRWVESAESFSEYRKSSAALFGPLQEQWAEEQCGAIGDAEVVLSHPLAPGVSHGAELRGLPLIYVSLAPFVATGRFNLFTRDSLWLRGPGNRLLWELQFRLGWEALAHGNAVYRARHGLPPVGSSVWRYNHGRGVPTLHLFSEHVAPRPRDWPNSAQCSGFCFLPAEPGAPVDPALRDFVEQGPPPLYLGFGSMTGFDPEVLAELCDSALARTDKRAVVCSGWGGARGAMNDGRIFPVDDVPHDWLFPRVSCVVHHGGAGTLAAALRAGKPSAIVPFFGDQPFWGHRAAALGVAPKPLMKRALSVDALARLISEADDSSAYRGAARDVAERLAGEDGVARAVRTLEGWLGLRDAGATAAE